MSSKCAICENRIFDEDGQCYGFQFKNGRWICDTCSVECIQGYQSSTFCQKEGCHNIATYEGWMRTGTLMRRISVCDEHGYLLIGWKDKQGV